MVMVPQNVMTYSCEACLDMASKGNAETAKLEWIYQNFVFKLMVIFDCVHVPKA